MALRSNLTCLVVLITLFQITSGKTQECERLYAPIDGNKACNPNNENILACDDAAKTGKGKVIIPSPTWRKCYDEVAKCRVDIANDNKARSDSLYKCQMEAKQKRIDEAKAMRDKERVNAHIAAQCRANRRAEICQTLD